MLSGITDKLLSIFEDMFLWMFDQFVKPFADIRGLKHLIFGREDESRSVWGTFAPDDLTNALGPTYYTMLGLAGFFLVSFVVLYGVRIASAPLNPSKRNETIELFKDLLIVGLLLVNLPTLYDLLFQVNSAIVSLFSTAYDNQSMDRWANIGGDIKDSAFGGTAGILGVIFIQLILLGLTLWANFYYFMRKVTLIILMALGPLMIVFWLHPKFKTMTGAWLKELIGSIFVQAVHAFVFWTVATLSSTEDGLVESVILYVIFIPIGEAVRRLLFMGGDMQGGLSKAGSMMGMAAIAGMYGSAKGAISGKSVMGAVKGAYEGTKDKKAGIDAAGNDIGKSMGSNAGGDSGTSPLAEKMLRSGDIVGRAGKATMGIAGAMAGSGLGPVGAMTGASIGFATGGVVGGVTGRVGAAAIQGLGAQLKKGHEGGLAFMNKQAGDFDDSFANEVADRETASWTEKNKTSALSGLRERFPDASQSELESKFANMQADKRSGFYNDAKQNLQAVQGLSEGATMVQSSARAMSSAWAKENQEGFYEDFDRNNPKKAGETNKEYGARRQAAFQSSKASMQERFAEEGNQYLNQNGINGLDSVSVAGFNKHMNQQIGSIVGGGNLSAYKDLAAQSVGHVQGANLFNDKGKPNVLQLASGLADARTAQMETAYVASQGLQNVSPEVARNDWKANHQTSAHAANVAMFKDSAEQASNNTFGAWESGNVGQRLGHTIAQAGKYSGGFMVSASGVPSLVAASSEVVGSAGQAGLAAHMALRDGNASGIKNFVKTAVPSAQAAWAGGVEQIIEQQGGAVEAQSNYQKSVGYGAGMVLGVGGYQAAQRIAAKVTPFNQQVQSAIHSPGEVIQMAQTTTDAHGNVQIAKGAIRQVVTAQESYIEVTTKGGEKQIVSRKGSGHSGMRKGDVVYQDLAVDGDSLVASSPVTYRVDSAGGRANSSVELVNNPSILLGNTRPGSSHQAVSRKQTPVYNQAVESGQFYTNDLSANGFENVQVVVEKNRQFMTGEKDGTTYRVSQVFAGDSRLQGNQTVQIPVNVSQNKVSPNYSAASAVAVEATSTDGSTVESIPYYSTKDVKGLISESMLGEIMPSKHADRANRSFDRRQALDTVRRKQGLLG